MASTFWDDQPTAETGPGKRIDRPMASIAAVIARNRCIDVLQIRRAIDRTILGHNAPGSSDFIDPNAAPKGQLTARSGQIIALGNAETTAA